MAISKDILRELQVESNAKKQVITDEELFKSPEFKEYIQNLADTVTLRYKMSVSVTCEHDETEGYVAKTNGKKVFVNTNNSLSRFYSTLLNRFLTQVGFVFHEIAHVVFLDFDAEARARVTLESGALFGDAPETNSVEEQEALDEMLNALAEPAYRPIFQGVFAHLSNIVSDAHDEAKICEHYGGYIKKCITVSSEALFHDFESVEAMERKLKDKKEKITKMQVMFSLALQYARYGDVIMEDPAVAIRSELVQALYSLSNALENARFTDDTKLKYDQLNRLCFVLWPYIKEELEKQDDSQSSQGQQAQSQSGQGGQGQQSQTPSQQAIQNVLDQLNSAAQSAGQTQAPEKGRSSATAKAAARHAHKQNAGGSQSPQGSAPSNDELAATLDNILSSIADKAAETKVEGDLTSTLLAEINAVDMNSTHKGKITKVERILSVTDQDRNQYNASMSTLKPYSKRLQKQMTDALRDLKDGSINRHLSFGNRFESKQSYRPDQKFYANKKQPQDLPDMALTILVDHSYSMAGVRLKESMSAAMLLHDFATGLGIPVHVAGHNSIDGGIKYTVYSDFSAAGVKDKFRLSRMKPSGSNRDGMAIEIAANLLSKREEDVKLLIIISDGQPNDRDYGGAGAAEDIRSIVKKYKRKGVETFAAAIGDDKDKVKAIYGDGFVDITNLDTLPKTLVSLVKKRIVN